MKLLALLLAILIPLVAARSGVGSEICDLEHSRNGDGRIACQAFIPSWTYNSAANTCVEFVYGGCGGNKNRFGSQAECVQTCLN